MREYMRDYIFMRDAEGQIHEVATDQASLTQAMVKGWSQCEPAEKEND